MSKIYLYIILFSFASLKANAQSVPVSKIIETAMQKCMGNLFFNIWEEKPDSVILPFLKSYVNILFKNRLIVEGGLFILLIQQSILK
jgi:hypothetical protein